MPFSPNVRAATFMVLGMSAFTINDVIVKTLLDEISAGQTLFIRGVMVVIMLTMMIKFSGRSFAFRQAREAPVILRGLFEAFAAIFFMLSLANMPIANISAILQALPLAVTLGAMFFFGEPVGWRRMMAILTGFAGVIIIIRPGTDGFNIYAIFMLICVLFATARDLATRKMDRNTSTMFASLVTAIFVSLTGVLIIPITGGWKPVSASNFAWLAMASVFLLGGYACLIAAMREGEISIVAPFRYSALLWAILLGYLVFGNLPDMWTMIGSAIVVGSGLYALLRERQRNRQVIMDKNRLKTAPPARGA